MTTRRRFLAAAVLAGVSVYIPGVGRVADRKVDEADIYDPARYPYAWQVSRDAVSWETVGYGESFVVPPGLEGFDMRVAITYPALAVSDGE